MFSMDIQNIILKCHMRGLSRENSNALLKDVIDQTKLKNASIGLIKVSPGQVIPWHYDSYVFYKKTNNVEEENNVERHIVFPFLGIGGIFIK